MLVQFYKFQGTGNDFIMIDNRNLNITLTKEQIAELTSRHFNIGADGIILLSNAEDVDFKMDYFNPDGSNTFCGNGGRCAVQFAKTIGIRKDKYHFMAADGQHEAALDDNNWVSIKMKDVHGWKKQGLDTILDTGVPHYVRLVKDVKELDVYTEGKAIRMSPEFVADGINVNFVEELDSDAIYVRTYERGVENETYSCGTGVTAAALVAAHNDRGFNRVDVETKGGHLAVEYDRVGEDQFQNIWLCGPAVLVFKGEVEIDIQPVAA